MSDKIEKFKEDVIIHGIVQLLFTMGALAVSTALGSAYLVGLFSSWSKYQLPIVVLAGGLGLYGGYRLFLWRNYQRPRFGKLKCPYIFTELTISYLRNSDGHVTYSRKYTVKPLVDGIDRFTDRYMWTGTKMLGNPSPKAPIHRLSLAPKEGLMQFFDVCLERAYNRSESIVAEVVWKLDDSDRKAAPFISRTIQEPTEKLTFIVEFPPEMNIHEVFAEMSQDAGAHNTINAWTITSKDQAKRFEWVVPQRPRLLHYYQIRWKPQWSPQ